jgi:hypothetical protein
MGYLVSEVVVYSNEAEPNEEIQDVGPREHGAEL